MSISIEEDLVLLDVSAKDKFDLLSQVADRLFEKGYVKSSYKDAVIAREKIFATGPADRSGGWQSHTRMSSMLSALPSAWLA